MKTTKRSILAAVVMFSLAISMISATDRVSASASQSTSHPKVKVTRNADNPATGQEGVPDTKLPNGLDLPTVNSYYVSPDASSGGDGSIGNPWDLQTALNQPSAVRPGDTIWLRGGTYVGTFASYLSGTSSAPIIVRGYPGEHAVIDKADITTSSEGNILTIHGSYTWYWGFEITNSDPTRLSDNADLLGRGTAIVVNDNATSHGDKFINLVIHDTEMGISLFNAADAEVYGCVVYYNGFQYPGGGRQHAIYTASHNPSDTGTNRIVDNIMFNDFAMGFHAYEEGEGGAVIQNLDIEGNTLMNNGRISTNDTGSNWILGGANPAHDITIQSNYLYNSPGYSTVNMQLGYSDSVVNQDVAVRDNYIVGGSSDGAAYWHEWQDMTVTGNTIYGYSGDTVLNLIPQGVSTSGYQWDNNSYYGGSSSPFDYNGSKSFASWKSATGLDSNSTYSSARPTRARVFVRPNQYEAGRANITVYNWDRAGTVGVDVSSLLAVGDRYEVRNAQNYNAPAVLSGTYNGGSLSLPMNGLSMAQPPGWNAQQATGPDFNVFVLLKTFGSGTPVPTPVTTATPIRTNTPPRTRTPLATQTPGGPTATDTPTPGDGSFADVLRTDYFYDAVNYLYNAGVVSGYSNNAFRPYNITTRGQLCKIIVLGEGWDIHTRGGPHFSDVPPSNTFYDYIETAYSQEVISGYADGTFRWSANINRGQLCKIIVLAFQWSLDVPDNPDFADVPEDNPFYDYIETAYRKGIISGYDNGMFRPNNPAIRGQICKIVYNALLDDR